MKRSLSSNTYRANTWLCFGIFIAVLALSVSTVKADEESVDLVGELNTIWAHPDPGSEETATKPGYLLVDDFGQTFQLTFEQERLQEIFPEGTGPIQFDRKRVRVQGIMDTDTGLVNVLSIRVEEPPPPIGSHLLGAHASGPQKWLTILCRFGDSTDVTPETLLYFEELMVFMDDYWREVSYDNISIDSTVVDWVNMAQNRADYLDDPATHFAGHTLDWGEAAADCAAAADSKVDFNIEDFDGINFVFNQTLDCCSWGGSTKLTLDGLTKTYSATWMSPGGWSNHDVLGQEMGHGFGLPHSSGPYSATYDSQWDVMSAGGDCSTPDPDFGCIGVHTIGFHKDALGWIPDARRYEATTDPDQVVFIERLAQPPNDTNTFLVAQIPIGGSETDFYTVEARKFLGFDNAGRIPNEAVVIHKVDTLIDDRNAQVVDVDAVANTDPNDDGAMWLPGELFEDTVNNISVGVLEETDSGFWVIINPTGVCGGLLATISGTPDDDPILGTTGDDVIAGLGGNDDINGLGGNDVICGGPGNDNITGGSENDFIDGDSGNDNINGGAGNDDIDAGPGFDIVNGGPGADTCRNGELVVGC